MGLFSSNGSIEREFGATPEQVGAAIESVAREQGHNLGTISPDRTRFELTTKRSAFSWGTAIALTLAPTQTGTRVVADFDTPAGAQKALLDGRKNTKAAEAFVEQLAAAL